MTNEEAAQELTNYILINSEPGKSLWHIGLTNDVIETAHSVKLAIYQDAKIVFDSLLNDPQRKFEDMAEIPEENNPTRVSVWMTT